MAMPIMLPSASLNGVGTLKECISRLNTRPVRAPVPRFTYILTDADAGLGVIVGRYSFDVRLSHPFLSAGLSRRTKRCANPTWTGAAWWAGDAVVRSRAKRRADLQVPWLRRRCLRTARFAYGLELRVTQPFLHGLEEHAFLEADVISQQRAETNQSGREVMLIVGYDPVKLRMFVSRSLCKGSTSGSFQGGQHVLLLD